MVWQLGCVIGTPGNLLWPAQGTLRTTAGLGGAESASVWLNACLAGGNPNPGRGWAVGSPFTFINELPVSLQEKSRAPSYDDFMSFPQSKPSGSFLAVLNGSLKSIRGKIKQARGFLGSL